MKRCLVGKKLYSGEIATIVAIGALIVIGVTSLFSSAFLGKKQTTSTKAATYTDGQTSDQGCAVYGCPAGTKRICTYTSASESWGCQCKPDSSCPGGNTGSGGGTGSGGTVTCNEGYYCEGNDCFKKLTSCGRDGPVDKSLCAGQLCGPQAPPPTSPPSNTGSGGNDGQSGECSWPDGWDCGASKCGSDAGCICGKMGKGFCNPGNCRSEGTGNVCVPNKWGDKSSWGCWGPPAGLCAPQTPPSPTPSGSSSSGGTNCTPGTGGSSSGKYYCCIGANLTLPYPHYEEKPSGTDCRAVSTTTTPASAGICTNYGVSPVEKNISCPVSRTETCSVGNISGTRYVNIACSIGNDSCNYSCKTAGDLSSNTYSGKCDNSDTCITSSPQAPAGAGSCTNYGVSPAQKNISCPVSRTETCSVGSTQGLRHVKIDCGTGNDSCDYKCKTVNDSSNTYSGKCDNSDTCITSTNTNPPSTSTSTDPSCEQPIQCSNGATISKKKSGGWFDNYYATHDCSGDIEWYITACSKAKTAATTATTTESTIISTSQPVTTDSGETVTVITIPELGEVVF